MKSFQSQTHYEVLEISVGADVEEIRAAYSRLTRLYSDEQVALYGLVDPLRADLLRKRLTQAVEVLTDEARREAYDVAIGLPPRDRPLPPRPPPRPAASERSVEVSGAWGQSFSWVVAPPAAAPSAPSPTVYAVSVDEAAATRALVPGAPPRPSQPLRAPPSPGAPTEPPTASPAPAAHPEPSPAVDPGSPLRAAVAPSAMRGAAPMPGPSPEAAAPSAPDVRGIEREPVEVPSLAAEALNASALTSHAPPAAQGVGDGAAASADLRAEPPPPVVLSHVDDAAAAERPPASVGLDEALRPTRESGEGEVARADPLASTRSAAGGDGESAPAAVTGSTEESALEVPLAGEAWDDEQLPRLSDDAEVSIIAARATPREYRAEPRPRPYEVPPGVEFNGGLLRQVRMARGLSLLQVSERTRISVKHLENVEGDRYEALPAPVYLRGILMSLARELGLDGLRVSRSYLTFVEARRAKG